MYDAAVSLYESIPAPDTSADFDYDNYNKKVEEALGKLLEGMSIYSSATEEVYSIYKDGANDFWDEQRKEGHGRRQDEHCLLQRKEGRRRSRPRRDAGRRAECMDNDPQAAVDTSWTV